MRRIKGNAAVEDDQTNATGRRARGEFVRGLSRFRNAIGEDEFPPEPDRYHLFVALNCPWCHRVILARNVLGLRGSVTMEVACPNRTGDDDPSGPNLWEFGPDRVATLTGARLPECTPEAATGLDLCPAKAVYQEEGSEEQSVPILYDKVSQRIVNTESAETIRMFDRHAKALGSEIGDDARARLYPEDDALRAAIEKLSQQIHVAINNGAHNAGFSADQAVCALAFAGYFVVLDQLDRLLSDGRTFLTGPQFAEADLGLFPTLYRHDPVYCVRMKLNGARIPDCPNLWRWLCTVYCLPGIAEIG